MTTLVVEAYEPYRITANDSGLADVRLMGFLPDASGTLTITDKPGGNTRTLVSALSVSAGSYVPLNIRCVGQITITVSGATGLLTYSA